MPDKRDGVDNANRRLFVCVYVDCNFSFCIFSVKRGVWVPCLFWVDCLTVLTTEAAKLCGPPLTLREER